MIICKDSVRFRVIRDETIHSMQVITGIFKRLGYQFEITCGTNGHPPTDPHFNGYAIDIHSKHLPNAKEGKPEPNDESIMRDIREALGPDYYIFLEDEGTDNEHYHCQVRKDLWPTLMEKEGKV